MITIRQALEILCKCNPDAHLRIYFPHEDCSDSVESIEEDVAHGDVYFIGFATDGQSIHSSQEVITHEGCFTQSKSRPIS